MDRSTAKFSDPGFYSTSLVRKVAERFLTSDPEYPSLLAEIVIPGGTSVGALVGAPDMIDERAEAEILLPRNTEFSIIATQPGAVPIIQTEVIT